MRDGTDGKGGEGGFIRRHGLWTDAQAGAAAALRDQLAGGDIDLIRVLWCDTHGCTRARLLTKPAFLGALEDGYSVGAGSWSLDASGGRVFQTFTAGGGMDLPEMTGSPNLVLVPDPGTFRRLPWAPGVASVFCDDYFRDGRPFFFSPRHLLRRVLAGLETRGWTATVGLEVEWTLFRLQQEPGAEAPVNLQGQRAAPPKAVPVEPGFSYDSENNLDRVQPFLSELASQIGALGLGLRSIDNELGAGQFECTFQPEPAWDAAGTFLLFRSAVRQIAARNGHLASFMTVPRGPGLFPSGWHLHLSLTDTRTGRNLFAPETGGEALSPLGMAFLAGQMEHTRDGIAFSVPTVNGYRRFRPNSLAPDRVTWNVEHRGVLMRVLGGPGDPATRIENRIGEPAANPYLAIAAQIVSGLDGVNRDLAPCPPDDAPYQAERPKLPTSLSEALDLLEASDFFREAFGETYLRYFLRMKRAELGRYDAARDAGGDAPDGDVTDGTVTDWEMNEYFDAY